MKYLHQYALVIIVLFIAPLSCREKDEGTLPMKSLIDAGKPDHLVWLDTLDSAGIESLFGWDSQCRQFQDPEDFLPTLILGRDRDGNAYSPMTWPLELVGDDSLVLDTLLRNYLTYYFITPHGEGAEFNYLSSPDLEENFLEFGETVGVMALVLMGRSHQAHEACDLYNPHVLFFMLTNRIFFPRLDLARKVLYTKFGILFRNFHGWAANDFKPGGVAQIRDSIWLKMH